MDICTCCSFSLPLWSHHSQDSIKLFSDHSQTSIKNSPVLNSLSSVLSSWLEGLHRVPSPKASGRKNRQSSLKTGLFFWQAVHIFGHNAVQLGHRWTFHEYYNIHWGLRLFSWQIRLHINFKLRVSFWCRGSVNNKGSEMMMESSLE